MGLLRRFWSRRRDIGGAVTIHLGNEDLEVVGEASYQDELWAICGARRGDRVRYEVVAVLVPEPDNPHDGNAIAVRIGGDRIGYLPRPVAASYVRGLTELIARTGTAVGLHGVVVGGGRRADGPGFLGVWLSHDPADFGAAEAEPPMRTGFSEAWRTDLDDDSYDLSWYPRLPADESTAIAVLRDLLVHERDPLDRHFQFVELQARLYRARDRPGALDDYDTTCAHHDAEMDSIRAAFIVKWNRVPLLDLYRQKSIREQKRGDWAACLRWAERGLEIYGAEAARQDAVDDLVKRRDRALAKIELSRTPAPSSGPSSR